MQRYLSLAAAVAVTFAAGCGWLKDDIEDLTTVEIPAEIPASFTLDASEACSTAIDGIDECDQAGSAPAPMEIELDSFEVDLNIDIADDTGETGNRIQSAADRLESVTITRIDWEVRDNSLSFGLPEIVLHVGPKDAQSSNDDGTFELAKIPAVPAETNDSGSTNVDENAQSEFSSLLKDQLKLSAIPAVNNPVIKQGQDVPPNGSATMDVTIHAEFVATPKSVVNN